MTISPNDLSGFNNPPQERSPEPPAGFSPSPESPPQAETPNQVEIPAPETVAAEVTGAAQTRASGANQAAEEAAANTIHPDPTSKFYNEEQVTETQAKQEAESFKGFVQRHMRKLQDGVANIKGAELNPADSNATRLEAAYDAWVAACGGEEKAKTDPVPEFEYAGKTYDLAKHPHFHRFAKSRLNNPTRDTASTLPATEDKRSWPQAQVERVADKTTEAISAAAYKVQEQMPTLNITMENMQGLDLKEVVNAAIEAGGGYAFAAEGIPDTFRLPNGREVHITDPNLRKYLEAHAATVGKFATSVKGAKRPGANPTAPQTQTGTGATTASAGSGGGGVETRQPTEPISEQVQNRLTALREERNKIRAELIEKYGPNAVNIIENDPGDKNDASAIGVLEAQNDVLRAKQELYASRGSSQPRTNERTQSQETQSAELQQMREKMETMEKMLEAMAKMFATQQEFNARMGRVLENQTNTQTAIARLLEKQNGSVVGQTDKQAGSLRNRIQMLKPAPSNGNNGAPPGELEKRPIAPPVTEADVTESTALAAAKMSLKIAYARSGAEAKTDQNLDALYQAYHDKNGGTLSEAQFKAFAKDELRRIEKELIKQTASNIGAKIREKSKDRRAAVADAVAAQQVANQVDAWKWEEEKRNLMEQAKKAKKEPQPTEAE